MSRLLTIAGVLASIALAACGGDDDSGTTPAPAEGAQEASAADDRKASGSGAKDETGAGTEVVLADSQYGPILFGPEQQAIYLFDKESSDTSRCYGACAEAWPPVLTKGSPEAGDGVDETLLGTTERNDGSTQVTYDGRPLYYYVDDPRGQILCHGVEEFGGVWLAVQADGNAVQ